MQPPQAFAEGADSLIPVWREMGSASAWPCWAVVTGITPLLGPHPVAAWEAFIRGAVDSGAKISLDLNHRPALGSFEELWVAINRIQSCLYLLILSEGNVHMLRTALLREDATADPIDAAMDPSAFSALLARLRLHIGLPLLACSIKRPLEDHGTAAQAHEATVASTSDRRTPTRRWSLLASSGGVSLSLIHI